MKKIIKISTFSNWLTILRKHSRMSKILREDFLIFYSVELQSILLHRGHIYFYECTTRMYNLNIIWNSGYKPSIVQPSACQINIGGYEGLNCASCSMNGGGKCDPKSCPAEYVKMKEKIGIYMMKYTIHIKKKHHPMLLFNR